MIESTETPNLNEQKAAAPCFQVKRLVMHGLTVNTCLGRRDDRIEKATACIESTRAKNIFVALAILHPDAGIFWDEGEHEATLEGDSFAITVSA